jgi:glucan endo-1,6-beta-glucosidase
MDSLLSLFFLYILILPANAQSIRDFGSMGGSGPSGGIGDLNHPVRTPQSFITDALVVPAGSNYTRQLAQGPPPVLLETAPSESCPSVRRAVVDSVNGARQEMLGFGQAWTDATVTTLNELEPDLFDQAMEGLFGQTGNNMGFMRHTIGSSDLSRSQYTYDDNGPSPNSGTPDLSLSNFALGPHGTAMAQTIAKMVNYKSDVFLMGSPWSFRGWTKYNGLLVAPQLNVQGGGSYMILNNSFDARYTPQMVQYFAKYVDAFEEHGARINGITPMNEPLNYQGGYPVSQVQSTPYQEEVSHQTKANNLTASACTLTPSTPPT